MTVHHRFKKIIATEVELRSVIGFPSELVKKKTISYLDQHCQDFISRSPLLAISTADQNGFCDVSPRGDKPGFVHILDENHLFIPERPGNKKIDSLSNILSNPTIGLLFIIPGLGETLRVNGQATVVQDDELLELTAIKGRKPLLGIGVKVEECFIHCAKAFKRSDLWDPKSWPQKETLPSAAKILADHAKIPDTKEDKVAIMLQESYTKRLY